jgi:UDP:flavonoid glycosyltransferase YjiC (YdhE family)
LSAATGPEIPRSPERARARRRLSVFLGAFGQPGHAFPMLALGAELVRRGHTVTYETWSRWLPEVQSAGMTFVPAPERGRTIAPGRWPSFYETAGWAAMQTRAAIRAARADVVVHDILTLGPALAAELEGVPVATLIPHVHPAPAPGAPPYAIGARLPRTAAGRAMWGALEPAMLAGLRLGARQLNEVRLRLDLEPSGRLHGGLSDRLCLVASFPGLEYPREWPDHVHLVGPLLWEPVSEWVRPPEGEEPLVLIAPSTAQDPDQRMLRAALDGLSQTGRRAPGWRVLASTNRRALRRPARCAANVRLVDWLSYARTMPGCRLVVCHAGHGTLVRALACGVPVLAVPHVGDMAENAARLDWSGAGLRLPWRLLSAAALRLAVQRALDPGAPYAARAADFARWMAAHDPARRCAELVEALAVGEEPPLGPAGG